MLTANNPSCLCWTVIMVAVEGLVTFRMVQIWQIFILFFRISSVRSSASSWGDFYNLYIFLRVSPILSRFSNFTCVCDCVGFLIANFAYLLFFPFFNFYSVGWAQRSNQIKVQLLQEANWEIVKDRDAWHAVVYRVEKSWTVLSNWKTTTKIKAIHPCSHAHIFIHTYITL